MQQVVGGRIVVIDVGVETLARDLHEAGRAAVESGQTLAQQVEAGGKTYTRQFVAWDDLPDHAREGRRVMARFLLARYDISERDPEWIPVQSSNVQAVRYLPRQAELQVRFGSGGAYGYSPVAPDVYAAFLRAESKGRYVNEQVKPRVSCRRLELDVLPHEMAHGE